MENYCSKIGSLIRGNQEVVPGWGITQAPLHFRSVYIKKGTFWRRIYAGFRYIRTSLKYGTFNKGYQTVVPGWEKLFSHFRNVYRKVYSGVCYIRISVKKATGCGAQKVCHAWIRY